MNLIESLIAQIISINKLQSKFLQSTKGKLATDEIESAEAYIGYCLSDGVSLEYLGNCYNLIVNDTIREQIYFKKNNRYRYSSYYDVCNLVYHNDEYMKMYMHGLALTSFLWPNHSMIMNYFKDTIPKNNGGNYIEIGPGHGFYIMEAMRLTEYRKFYGIDLSPTSVLMTKALLESGNFGKFTNYKIEVCDFIHWNGHEKYAAVVLGEVLEHVENPELFLQKICDITDSNSYIYVTTCINTPAIDHIYLFKTYDHILTIIENCGLIVKDKLLIPYNNLTLEESERQSLPINVAMVLGNKHG